MVSSLVWLENVTPALSRGVSDGGSVMPDSATPWTAALQAPLSVGFSRQEHWSGLPCPPPGDLPDPGNKPTSLIVSLAVRFFTTSATWEVHVYACLCVYVCVYTYPCAKHHEPWFSTPLQRCLRFPCIPVLESFSAWLAGDGLCCLRLRDTWGVGHPKEDAEKASWFGEGALG